MSTIPRPTTLALGDPVLLLQQLQGDVDPADLLSTATTASENPATVHYLVLRRALTATTPKDAEPLLPCLQRLIEIKAPLFATYPTPQWEHPMALFCEYPWPTSQQVLSDALRSHLASGLLDANAVLPGDLPSESDVLKDDSWPVDGLSPLAAAIDKSNAECARILCDFGASFDVGPVHLGGRRWGALEFAEANRDADCRAVLVEVMMRRQLADTGPEPARTVVRARRGV